MSLWKLLLLISMNVSIHTKLILGKYAFYNVNSLEIRSSVRTLTDIAKVTIPRRVFLSNGNLVTDLQSLIPSNEDVAVEIWAGYNGNLSLEFKGYVDYYEPRESLTIFCQDEMYKLKRGTVRKAFEAAKLKDVLNEIAGAYVIDVPDITMGNLLFKNMSPVAILKKLQEDYSIYSYFKPGTTELVSGFPYDQTYDTHVLHLQRNVKDHRNLSYEKRDPAEYQVTAISNQADGSKLTVKVPENAPAATSTRTLNFGPLTKAELTKFAEGELKRFNFTGYRGQVVTFGQPIIKPGDIIDITDAAYNRQSRNLVDEVVTRIAPVYFDRTLTLGPQV